MKQIDTSTLQGEEEISTTWDITVEPRLSVTRNPGDAVVDSDFGTTTQISLTANKTASFNWYLEGLLEKTDNNVSASTYDFSVTEAGPYLVECVVTSGTETVSENWIVNYGDEMVVTINPPEGEIAVVQFDEPQTFEAHTTLETSFQWYVDNVLIESEVGFSSSITVDTDTPKSISIVLIFTSGGVTESRSWTYTVEEKLVVTLDTAPSTITLNQGSGDFFILATSNIFSNFEWVYSPTTTISNTGVESAYIQNTNTLGTFFPVLNVTSGTQTQSFMWQIDVIQSEATIVSVSPETYSIETFSGVPLQFSVTASRSCEIRWVLNNVTEKSETSDQSTFSYTPTNAGTDELAVILSNGEISDAWGWTIFVEEPLDFSFISPLPQTFDMLVNDEETLTVSTNKAANFIWYVDGTEVSSDSGVSNSSYVFVPTQVKPYSIEVVATSGTETLSSSLSVNSLQEPTEGTSMIPLLAVAGIGVYLLAGRKKKK